MSLKTIAMSLKTTAMSLKRKAMSGNKAPMKGHKLTILVPVISAIFTALPAQSQEATVNLSSTITGNREQPKVLYIVPWKAVNDSELEEQTIQSQLDIVFGHVERIELQRELQFMEQIAKAAKKEEQ